MVAWLFQAFRHRACRFRDATQDAEGQRALLRRDHRDEREGDRAALKTIPRFSPVRRDPDMPLIPGGTFLMGSNEHYPEEAPAHRVTVGAFWMDRCAVTNAGFRDFVDATGYVTL